MENIGQNPQNWEKNGQTKNGQLDKHLELG